MFGRRSFLISCGGMAAAPAIAQLGLPTTDRLAAPSPLADSLDATALPSAAEPAELVLRIDGWETPHDPGHALPGETWVHINSSWRAAWR